MARVHTDRERLAVLNRFRFRGYSLRAYQMPDEISALLDELRARRVKRVLEIGTARGGTLFLLLQALGHDARVVSLDLPGGRDGGGYPHWKIALFHSIAWGGPSLKLLRGDSHDARMKERTRLALGGPADFILIDGDHTYEGVKRDFDLYRDLVAPGGMIAFHDIVPDARFGVARFWGEIKDRYPHKEFVKDWKQVGYGLGVLFF